MNILQNLNAFTLKTISLALIMSILIYSACSPYDASGFDKNGNHRSPHPKYGPKYAPDGFDKNGLDPFLFKKDGTYSKPPYGFRDPQGFNIQGFDEYGYRRDKTFGNTGKPANPQGFIITPLGPRHEFTNTEFDKDGVAFDGSYEKDINGIPKDAVYYYKWLVDGTRTGTAVLDKNDFPIYDDDMFLINEPSLEDIRAHFERGNPNPVSMPYIRSMFKKLSDIFQEFEVNNYFIPSSGAHNALIQPANVIIPQISEANFRLGNAQLIKVSRHFNFNEIFQEKLLAVYNQNLMRVPKELIENAINILSDNNILDNASSDYMDQVEDQINNLHDLTRKRRIKKNDITRMLLTIFKYRISDSLVFRIDNSAEGMLYRNSMWREDMAYMSDQHDELTYKLFTVLLSLNNFDDFQKANIVKNLIHGARHCNNATANGIAEFYNALVPEDRENLERTMFGDNSTIEEVLFNLISFKKIDIYNEFMNDVRNKHPLNHIYRHDLESSYFTAYNLSAEWAGVPKLQGNDFHYYGFQDYSNGDSFYYGFNDKYDPTVHVSGFFERYDAAQVLQAIYKGGRGFMWTDQASPIPLVDKFIFNPLIFLDNTPFWSDFAGYLGFQGRTVLPLKIKILVGLLQKYGFIEVNP